MSLWCSSISWKAIVVSLEVLRQRVSYVLPFPYVRLQTLHSQFDQGGFCT